MLAPDFVDHNLIPSQQPGREGYLRSFTAGHSPYSHARFVIEKQVAEADEVVTIFAVSALHDRGGWMGIARVAQGQDDSQHRGVSKDRCRSET